ncbi:MAG TPA: hypothetical protein EYQ82_11365 [Dehalococcoidia bacterium]|nr:hypothetical protein [Dehalococcoidia bacterium]HIK98334.1 hypothetical protein [Dehalococcoidia bacterium]
MSNRTAKRNSDQGTVLACRSLPLPIFALYGMGAASVTWMIAAWRDRRRTRRLREEIRARSREEEDGDK